jgi:hypothetical protein
MLAAINTFRALEQDDTTASESEAQHQEEDELGEAEIATQPLPEYEAPPVELDAGASFIVGDGVISVVDENKFVTRDVIQFEIDEMVDVSQGSILVLDRIYGHEDNKRIQFIITPRRFYQFLGMDTPTERLASDIAQDFYKFSDMIWRGRLRPKVYNARFNWKSFAFKHENEKYVLQTKF